MVGTLIFEGKYITSLSHILRIFFYKQNIHIANQAVVHEFP